MLKLSKPKNSRNWYVGGTIKVGGKKATLARRSTGLSDKRKAESYRAQLQTKTEQELLYGKKHNSAESVTLYYACEIWGKLKDPKRAQTTIAKQILARLGNTTALSEITPQRWMEYRASHMQGKSPSTVKMHKAVIRAWFAAIGAEAPQMAVPKDKGHREKKLSLEVANSLLNAYPKDIRGPATFARYGGLRANEVARLRLEHINWETQEIELPAALNKNKRQRKIPMHPLMIAAAQGSRENESGFVFEMAPGVPFPYDEYRKLNPFYEDHLRSCRAIGLKGFTWHDWRHHWAYKCIEGGMDIRTLQKIGGWSSLEMVAKYLAPNYEKAREVLKVMK